MAGRGLACIVRAMCVGFSWCGCMLASVLGRWCLPFEELRQRWRGRNGRPFTCFLQSGCSYGPALSIRVRLRATMHAVDAISSLPKEMGGVSTVFMFKSLVDTWSFHIGCESFLIRAFVYALTTVCAAEVPFGFFKLSLIHI